MKLKLALVSTLLALGATTTQAADTRSPSILASVSSDSVQKMTENEASKIRGEWYQCNMTINNMTGQMSKSCRVHVRWQKHRPKSSQSISADGKYTYIRQVVWARKMLWRLHVAR